MTDPLHQLIATLREELQSYGELLALLDRQQESVFARAANELFESVGGVHALSAELARVRATRDAGRSAVAASLGLPPDAPFNAILPLLPPDYQPLVQALVQENNELLVRVHQRARQNHLLLSRSVELMQRFLSSLFPGCETPVYTGAGLQRPGSLPVRPVYDAIG